VALTVTVLGSSGTYAGPDNACSGYLVRGRGVTVLLDAGPGTLANLQHHVPVTGLDAVVLSHVHPDHWLELPVLRNALHYVHDTQGVPLFTTAEVLTEAEHLTAGGLSQTFRPTAITDGSEFRVGPLSFRTARTDHPPETLAVRVDDGEASVAYTSDTGPRWGVADLAPAVDLVLSEATYPDHWADDPDAPDAPTVHLSGAQAGRLAREAGARRLVVTHALPTASADEIRAEAEDAFGATIERAVPHRTFEV
jgi:ribonuclease BN (tRNA processing enzyme)